MKRFNDPLLVELTGKTSLFATLVQNPKRHDGNEQADHENQNDDSRAGPPSSAGAGCSTPTSTGRMLKGVFRSVHDFSLLRVR